MCRPCEPDIPLAVLHVLAADMEFPLGQDGVLLCTAVKSAASVPELVLP